MIGEIKCYKMNNFSGYVIENFESISNGERVEMTIPLISPFYSSGYRVDIASYDIAHTGYIDYTAINISISTTCKTCYYLIIGN